MGSQTSHRESCLLLCDYAVLLWQNKAIRCARLALRLQIAFEDQEKERAYCPGTESPLHSQPTLKRHGSCLTASSSSGGSGPWDSGIKGKTCMLYSNGWIFKLTHVFNALLTHCVWHATFYKSATRGQIINEQAVRGLQLYRKGMWPCIVFRVRVFIASHEHLSAEWPRKLDKARGRRGWRTLHNIVKSREDSSGVGWGPQRRKDGQQWVGYL